MERYKVKPNRVSGMIRLIDNTTGKLHKKMFKTTTSAAIWLFENQEHLEEGKTFE